MLIWVAPQEGRREGPLLFLDRDGVLNEDREEYVRRWEEVKLYDDTFHALPILQRMGYRFVIVSNQSGIARGYITLEHFWDIHFRLCETLSMRGIHLAGAWYCPHHPEEGCRCRKPEPMMLTFASQILHGDLKQSVLIGDRWSDMEAARRAGCRGILLVRDGRDGKRAPEPPWIAPHPALSVCTSLEEAIAKIREGCHNEGS